MICPYPATILYEIMSLMHVRRFWLAGVVLVAVLALLPFSFHAERHLETATRVEGSEAETVRQELATRFHSPFVDRVVLVIQGLPPADSEEGEQALATIEAGLKEEPGVSGVVSYLDLRDPIFLGKGGGTFILVGLASTEGPVESLVPKLHERANSLQNQLRGRYPAVKLELTGETPLNFDIRKASADDVRHAESLVIPATLALLLVAFGSLVAALIPLAVGQLAIAITLAIAGFLALRWHLSILVQNLSTMLGLGLGIDYALLMVSRFREAICAGNNGPTASVIAARQADRVAEHRVLALEIGELDVAPSRDEVGEPLDDQRLGCDRVARDGADAREHDRVRRRFVGGHHHSHAGTSSIAIAFRTGQTTSQMPQPLQ